MEDAVEQLDRLARSVGECSRCEELVACRLRAVPGGGHPHCAVMVVSLQPDPDDERGGLAGGSATLAGLASFMPALTDSPNAIYTTSLVKCVPRDAGEVRDARPEELERCYPYFSREVTITTPHYVLTVGETTTRFVLGKLFKDHTLAPGDPLELRLFDNPAFKVVPVATPRELEARDTKARKDYVDRLRALSQVMGL